MLTELLDGGVEDAGGYIAEVVYGANDGIITTFAIVAGVAGAALDPGIVLILGFANLFADGFSMGMSNFLSQRSAMDYQTAQTGTATAVKPPSWTALTTFLAFVFAGWMPLLPYVVALVLTDPFGGVPTFSVSVAATAVAFFGIGASRSVVTDRKWPVAGTEMLGVGMLAAGVAFAVGILLGGLA
ncbi:MULTISPECIES: VIT1/CCC1 transporter family protein [Haloarcula]|uniref:Membrane protein n=1 Tax=Haloarcula pellucida TaxID=1427151 RepID=A0A830GN46_9EURY|nr:MULTISPECIES: VIT1/CCC1 transporter family protein [Halomicroarcula]MBX0347902.1 VIT1/CCC1 transporter family protein [Halomicroarcula pellucida]MDS0279969.1 VIT1/CCC1 transporter family protein [Halomicroarcula sp. S1AR25-4]GGN95981.1 membrane protein [Halomicroarcula pellucida]